ncbi:hypothetical protein VPH35_053310 [Triticum aestivum]
MVSDVHVPTELPAPSHLVRELRRRPLLRLHAPIRTGSPCIDGIDAFLFLGHHRLRRRSAASAAPKPSPSHPCAPRPRERCCPMIDYVDDDTSSFSAELPDGGAQDPDDPTDDYYYPEGAYYYVETADDQE